MHLEAIEDQQKKFALILQTVNITRDFLNFKGDFADLRLITSSKEEDIAEIADIGSNIGLGNWRFT